MHVPPVFVAANHVYVAVYLCVWRTIALEWGQLARRPQAGTAVTKTPRPEWADTVLIPSLDPEPVPRRNVDPRYTAELSKDIRCDMIIISQTTGPAHIKKVCCHKKQAV